MTFLLAALLFLPACSSKRVLGVEPDTGTMITVSEALDARSYGRTVTVKGTVAKVCQEEGCWMVITDGTKSVRMTFKNESFTVPLTLHGDVVVGGVVQEELVDEETARTVAASMGMTDSVVASMHGDQRIPLMMTSGIILTE